jgi:hypothetical protein
LTIPEAITRFGILNLTGLSDREPVQIEVPPVATMSKDEIRKLTAEQMRDAVEHPVRELERTKLLALARNLHRGSTRKKCTKRRYRSDLMYRR